MEYTTRQIAEILEGNLVGDPTIKINSLSKIEDGVVGSLTFLANPKYESFLYTTQASAVVVNKNLVPSKPVKVILILVDDAYSAFTILLEKFKPTTDNERIGIEEPCFIHKTAVIGEKSYIGSFSYIGKGAKLGIGVSIFPQVYIGDNVIIGDHSIIYPGVKIYRDCEIGQAVIIHSGAIIGSDGFGFSPNSDGSYTKIVQSGNVVIENLVEIGSNTCIDRATLGSTYIRKGVKLDNLIQIAHNVEIGHDTVIAAQTGISGSTKLGENCLLGGQIGVVGHISIGKGNHFGAKTGISKTIRDEGKQFRGQPMQSYKESLKTEVLIRNLSKMEKRITELELALEQKKVEL